MSMRSLPALTHSCHGGGRTGCTDIKLDNVDGDDGGDDDFWFLVNSNSGDLRIATPDGDLDDLSSDSSTTTTSGFASSSFAIAGAFVGRGENFGRGTLSGNGDDFAVAPSVPSGTSSSLSVASGTDAVPGALAPARLRGGERATEPRTAFGAKVAPEARASANARSLMTISFSAAALARSSANGSSRLLFAKSSSCSCFGIAFALIFALPFSSLSKVDLISSKSSEIKIDLLFLKIT